MPLVTRSQGPGVLVGTRNVMHNKRVLKATHLKVQLTYKQKMVLNKPQQRKTYLPLQSPFSNPGVSSAFWILKLCHGTLRQSWDEGLA